jgi:hypothetical protein
MAETTQQTPYLPLVGRSDDAYWRRRGGGSCVVLSRRRLGGCPHPSVALCGQAARAVAHRKRARRRTSPQGGGMERELR